MKLTSLIVSLVLGASLVLIFEPFNYWFLSFFIPLSFYLLIEDKNVIQSFVLGWFLGFGLWVFGIFWIENSIYFYGGASKITSFFLVICLSAFLATISGLFFSLFAYFKTKTEFDILLLFPSIWVGTEWLREFLFSGFPWFYLGYATLDNFFVSGFIPIFGVFGMSFILIFIPALIFTLFKSLIRKNEYKKKLAYSAFLLLIFFSSSMAYQTEWTKEKEEINVVVIQPNISIEEKWNYQGEIESINLFKSKIIEHSLKSENKEILSIVFWPEVFLPGLSSRYKKVIDEMEKYVADYNIASIFGTLTETAYEEKGITNSLFSLGKLNGKFDKQKLVPFGEYIPFTIFDSLFNFFNFNRPNIVSSNNNVLIQSDSLNISSAICYEIAFQDIFLKHGKQSNILFNASNDNWFGNTIGPHQHLQIARYRAAENRKPLIRSTSTGISALVDKFGNIIESIDLDNEKNILLNSKEIESIVFSRSGHTPFVKIGKWPSIFFILFIMFIAFLIRMLRR